MSAQRELNPLFRPGKAAGCRYIMGACLSQPNCQGAESTGPDSNWRIRITGAESWPLDDQCLSVGPEVLEPSPTWLRARDAAASTLVLWNQLAQWELNPRPATYKDAALTAELRPSVE